MFNALRAASSRSSTPSVDGDDWRALVSHPHFKSFAEFRPYFPDDGSEEARSWFGGTPKIPDSVSWPRDAAATPFLFLAQICCADLPDDLWGGIGPRQGWLLIFVHPTEFEFRVLHTDQLGPERHVDCDLDHVPWEWHRREPQPSGAPRFRRVPVHPDAQKMPADVMLPPKLRQSAPPLRPRTWGEFDLVLTWLENEYARPRPKTSQPNKKDHRERKKARSRYDEEPDERQALRAEALARSEQAHAAYEEAKLGIANTLRPWLARSRSHDPSELLEASDWGEFVQQAMEIERPKIKMKILAPEVVAEVSEIEAPFCLWWHPFVTKADFETQATALNVFSVQHHRFSGSGSYYSMDLERRLASEGKGSWTEVQEKQFKRQKRLHDIEMRLRDANADYGRAFMQMRKLMETLKDSDEVNPDQMQDFLIKTRKNTRYACWHGERIGKSFRSITETTLTSERPLVPGLTADGLTPSHEAPGCYAALGNSLLEAYAAGTLARAAIPDAQSYADYVWNPGRTAGGLPFFGHHDPSLMDLHAYGSPKHLEALKHPINRAVYGDVEAMEPQCLLLNLGSHDPVGWLWGDCYTLTLYVPRADLEAGRFDRVKGFIDNG